MHIRNPLGFKRIGGLLEKFFSPIAATVIITACIAAATTANPPGKSATPALQKADMAVFHERVLDDAVIPVSPHDGPASTVAHSPAKLADRIPRVPLPPKRPKIEASVLRARNASADIAFSAAPLLASPTGSATIGLGERSSSYASALELRNWAQPGQERSVDAGSILISPVEAVRHRGTEALYSVRGWGSSVIDTLPQVWP